MKKFLCLIVAVVLLSLFAVTGCDIFNSDGNGGDVPADNKKDGGAYITFIGRLKKIDNYKRIFVFEDGREIQICNIINMDVLD